MNYHLEVEEGKSELIKPSGIQGVWIFQTLTAVACTLRENHGHWNFIISQQSNFISQLKK